MAWDENYIEEAFYAWYENGRSFKNFVFPQSVGKKPSIETVKEWASELGWVQRADVLDAQVAQALDTKVINRRVEMFERHVQLAEDLIQKGLAYLAKNGIESDNSAIRAISLGMDTQRMSVGVAEAYAQISKMSNDQLEKELLRLTGRDKAIDGELVEDTEE